MYKRQAKASYAALQQEIMADYADMKAAVTAADTLEAKQMCIRDRSICVNFFCLSLTKPFLYCKILDESYL